MGKTSNTKVAPKRKASNSKILPAKLARVSSSSAKQAGNRKSLTNVAVIIPVRLDSNNLPSLAEHFREKARTEGRGDDWSCENCLARNKSTVDRCASCEEERGGSATTTTSTNESVPMDTNDAWPVGATAGSTTGHTTGQNRATTGSSGEAMIATGIGSNGFVFGGFAAAPSEGAPETAGTPIPCQAGYGACATSASAPTSDTTTKAVPAYANSLPPIDWRKIFILGENIHNGNMQAILAEEWDHSAVEPTVRRLLDDNPDCDVFLFGKVEPYTSSSAAVAPTVCAIVILSGQVPPEFVAVRNYQAGKEEIRTFQQMKLKWQPIDGRPRVFCLQCMLRPCSMKNRSLLQLFAYEYASLYTMRPSVDWAEKNGKLDVRYAMFQYISDGLPEGITEAFNRDEDRIASFVPDFLDRHDLPPSHGPGVESAIKAGFIGERARKESMIRMFAAYDSKVLEEIFVAKIYPRDDVFSSKTPYVNEYYRKALIMV